MALYGKDNSPATDTNTIVNWCRAHPIPASTISETNPILKYLEIYVGTAHTSQVRCGVYQGGTITDPSGATLIADLGVTSGSGTAQWLRLDASNESLDPAEITWVVFAKGNDSGFDVRYSTSSFDAEDWSSTAGRYVSVAISADETVALPDPWPTDSGSQSDFWYNCRISVEAASLVISDVDHNKLFPLCPNPDIVGVGFNASQSTSRAYLSPSATWVLADALELEVVSWADTLVVVKIGSLEPVGGGNRFIHIVHTPTGTPDPSNGFAVVADYPDHLLQCKKLTSPATNGVVSVTFDKTPRAVWIMAIDKVADGSEVDAKFHLGVLTADGFCAVGVFSDDSVASWSRHQSDATWIHYSDTGGVEERATPSISGKDVEFNFTTTVSDLNQIYIVALCSDTDLIDTAIDHVAVSLGAVSGLGFAPDTVWMGTAGEASFPTETTVHALMSIGIATADDESGIHSYWGDPNTNASSLIDSTTVLAQLAQGVYAWEMTAFTFTSTGFSWTGSNADDFWYLALKLNGARCSSAVVTVPTGTAPFDTDLHDFGWVVQGMISMTASEPSQNEANSNGGRMSFGFNDGTEALTTHVNSDGTGVTGRSQNSDSAEGHILAGGDDATSPTWRLELHQDGGPMVRENVKANVALNDNANDRVLIWAVESVNKYDSAPGIPL